MIASSITPWSTSAWNSERLLSCSFGPLVLRATNCHRRTAAMASTTHVITCFTVEFTKLLLYGPILPRTQKYRCLEGPFSTKTLGQGTDETAALTHRMILPLLDGHCGPSGCENEGKTADFARKKYLGQ